MRFAIEGVRRGFMLRCWSKDYLQGEIAWAKFGIGGLRLVIEFPSDWHEAKRAWLNIGLGVLSFGVSVPWSKTVPDHYQCSGPRYGFYFFEDHLVLLYGKAKGTRDDPSKFINMPWHWRHREHKVLSQPETHPYSYKLRSGEFQDRTATIQKQSRLWTRYWIPWRMYVESIDIDFSDEVGERTGSWKGGTTGCSYAMKAGETMLQTLRRMERERKF